MICQECGKKMHCNDTANDPEKMETARRYKCPICGKHLYTLEKVVENSSAINYIMSVKWNARKG